MIYEDDHGDYGLKDDSHEGQDIYHLSGAEINMSTWSTLTLMNESFLQDRAQGLLIINHIIVIHIILIGYRQLD